MCAYSDVDDLLQVPGDKNACLQIHLGLCYAWCARNVGDFSHCRHEQILSSKDTSIFFFVVFYETYYLQFIFYIRNSAGGGSQLITSFRCSCLFLIGCSRTFSFLHHLALSLSLYATTAVETHSSRMNDRNFHFYAWWGKNFSRLYAA